MSDRQDIRDLAIVLERAHANLDAQPDRYPMRQPASPRPRAPHRDVVRAYTYLSHDQRTEAIHRSAAGETFSAIARSLGVSHTTIRRAVLGITQKRDTE